MAFFACSEPALGSLASVTTNLVTVIRPGTGSSITSQRLRARGRPHFFRATFFARGRMTSTVLLPQIPLSRKQYLIRQVCPEAPIITCPFASAYQRHQRPSAVMTRKPGVRRRCPAHVRHRSATRDGGGDIRCTWGGYRVLGVAWRQVDADCQQRSIAESLMAC